MATEIAGTSQFYIPESRQTLIQRAYKGLQGNKIVALQGEAGVGKTTLIEEILTQSFPDANKCYVTAAPSLSDIQIRSRIIEQLFGHVLFDPELPLVTSFMEFNRPVQMMIAIDNAHYLSGRLTGELLQLISESKNLGIKLALVLTFDKSISSTLLNVSAGLVEILNIGLLNKNESYHLLVEYFDDIPEQTNSKVKRWIEASNGVPLQLLAYGEEEETQPEAKPLNLALWISVLFCGSLALALGIYLYRLNLLQDNALTDTTPLVKEWQPPSVAKEQAPATAGTIYQELIAEPINDTSAQIIQELTATPDNEEGASAPKGLSEQLAESKNKVSAASEENLVPSKEETEIVADTPKQQMTNLDKPSTSELDKDELAALNQALVAALEREVQELEQTKAETPQQDDSVLENVPSAENSEDDISLDFFDNTAGIENPLQANNTINNEQQIIEGVVANENEGQPILVNELTYQIDNQKFLALPRNKFSLQVTAVSSESVLAEYLASTSLPVEELNIYKIQRSGKDWIVVTYGLFDNIELARVEASKVAPKAWAKSIAVIQQQIIAYQKSQEEQ